jgi:hypothetical protein
VQHRPAHPRPQAGAEHLQVADRLDEVVVEVGAVAADPLRLDVPHPVLPAAPVLTEDRAARGAAADQVVGARHRHALEGGREPPLEGAAANDVADRPQAGVEQPRVALAQTGLDQRVAQHRLGVARVPESGLAAAPQAERDVAAIDVVAKRPVGVLLADPRRGDLAGEARPAGRGSGAGGRDDDERRHQERQTDEGAPGGEEAVHRRHSTPPLGRK